MKDLLKSIKWTCYVLFASLYVLQAQTSPSIQVLSNPIHINEEGLDFKGTTNLIIVPENRTNKDSRMIAVQYFYFPAKTPSYLAPVYYLPGGPGGMYAQKHFYERYGKERATAWTFELEILNEKRDLIIVNQRGQSYAPGFPLPNFEYNFERGRKDEVLDLEKKAKQQTIAFEKCIQQFNEYGVDVKGYDITNMVEDLESIRSYHDHEEIALVGTSFGSQWAMAYMHMHTDKVDRLLLSGVEPLDHSWDDPKGIWNVLKRIEKEALENQEIASHLPKIGLTEAVKLISSKLKSSPVKVPLKIEEKNLDDTILLGVDDFHYDFMCPFAEDRTEALELWPKYISEIYRGDFTGLAFRANSGREGKSWSLMMNHLVDNSLDISPQRELFLKSRKESDWIGRPFINYLHTRTVNPTNKISEDLRKPIKNPIPILMIQGNMDWNTPIENAHYVQDHYTQTHLITINRGTHSSKRELILSHKKEAAEILDFMNQDFTKTSFSDYKRSLPDQIDLPGINFDPIQGSSILDEVLGNS